MHDAKQDKLIQAFNFYICQNKNCKKRLTLFWNWSKTEKKEGKCVRVEYIDIASNVIAFNI